MAATDNENLLESQSIGQMTLSDAAAVTNAHPGQILLVGPDGFVSPAMIDESGVVRELGQGVNTNENNMPDENVIQTSADILHQAFREAGNDFTNDNSEMTAQIDREETNASNGNTVSYLTTEDGQIINSVIESTFTGIDGNQYAIIKSQEDGSQQIVMTGSLEGLDMSDVGKLEEQEQTLQIPEFMQNGETAAAVESQVYADTPEPDPEPPLPEIANEKPLGSSENPIRIIQQGNQYTSLQQLTPEQLQHIMQVLQQQQVVKPAQRQGTTTLYSPQTNTKIVYRVIYPGEKKDAMAKTDYRLPVTGFRGRGRGRGRGKVIPGTRGRGRPRKYPAADEEVDPATFPELSKEEKDKRKKIRPRTRSGRVSKPPKHMVKDYKQIHLVDWAEDYDDSDGGYSDFQPSDNDNEQEDDESASINDDDMDSGYGAGKARNHKCETCGKGYMGQGSLNRHYRIHPDHGTPTEEPKVSNGLNEESNSSSASNQGLNRNQRIFRRGKLPQRLSNLREVVRHFSNEELMEIVLPRLTQCLSTWEFMLMKSEKPEPGGTALKPSIPAMLAEYELLLRDVRQYGSQRLTKLPERPQDTENAIKIDDVAVADSLGLAASEWYHIGEESETYIPMKYKYSKAASNFKERLQAHGMPGEADEAEESENRGEPPAKRVRIEDSLVSVQTPDGATRMVSISQPTAPVKRAPNQITLVPSAMRGRSAGEHGRIVVERGSPPKSTTVMVSDLIAIRGDGDGLVVDAADEINDVKHSPEAMLQSTYKPTCLTGNDVAASVDQPSAISHLMVTEAEVMETSNFTQPQTAALNVTPPIDRPHTNTSTSEVTQKEVSEPEVANTVVLQAGLSQSGVSEAGVSLRGVSGVTLQDDTQAELSSTEANEPNDMAVTVSESQAVRDEAEGVVGHVLEGVPVQEETMEGVHVEGDHAEGVTDTTDTVEGSDAGNVVILQTEDGYLWIQKPDGTTLQVQHSGEALSLDTLQYVLSMDATSQPEQPEQLDQ